MSGWSPLESGRVRLKRPNSQVTHLDACGSAVCFCGSLLPDRLVMHSDNYPIGLRIAFFLSYRISLIFLSFLSWDFCLFRCFFSCFRNSSQLISSFCAFYLFSRYFASFFALFSILLFWNIFWDKRWIFLSIFSVVVIGIFVLSFFFGLCWHIITYLFILGSPFYCRYNAKISGTNKN